MYKVLSKELWGMQDESAIDRFPTEFQFLVGEIHK